MYPTEKVWSGVGHPIESLEHFLCEIVNCHAVTRPVIEAFCMTSKSLLVLLTEYNFRSSAYNLQELPSKSCTMLLSCTTSLSLAGKVTVGLALEASHWPCITDPMAYPPRRGQLRLRVASFSVVGNGDCLKGKRENYQVCSVQYCVQQLCIVQCTHIWTDLTVLWIGFCLTGPFHCA